MQRYGVLNMPGGSLRFVVSQFGGGRVQAGAGPALPLEVVINWAAGRK